MSKSLVEAQDEINELKHKLKVKSYQVEQLKEDISTKEGLLVKEEFSEYLIKVKLALTVIKKMKTCSSPESDEREGRIEVGTSEIDKRAERVQGEYFGADAGRGKIAENYRGLRQGQS